MPGVAVVTAFAMALLGGGPLWPDLNKLPAVTGGGEKDVAVVVAVEDYAHLSDVPGALEVGQLWDRYFREVRKVPFTLLLSNNTATVGGIRKAVASAAERVNTGGRLWFVFVGHGAPALDGKRGVLVTVNAQDYLNEFYENSIALDELESLLTQGSARQPPVMILDACFSGKDRSGKELDGAKQFLVPLNMGDLKEAVVLSAGGAADLAGQLPGGAVPAFSYLLLGALRGWGDTSKDGRVTASEAVLWVEQAVEQLAFGLLPKPKMVGADFEIVKLTGKRESSPDIGAIRRQLRPSRPGSAEEMEPRKNGGLSEKLRKIEEEKWRQQARVEEMQAGWKQALEIAKDGGATAERAVEAFLEEYGSDPPSAKLLDEARAHHAELLRKRGYILVNPGCFLMGSPSGEEGGESDETQHEVCVTKGFYLKETEVTQGEWRDVVGNNPSYFSSCGDTCPVERVSWFEAVAYANALSEQEGLEPCYTLSGCSGTLGGGCAKGFCDGDYECSDVSFKGLSCKGYRLPTEAEWQYAARAGSREARYGTLDDIAWYDGNSGSKTHPVLQKRANAWGFYDMLGNVWEWAWDWLGDYDSTRNDPQGATSGSERVCPGGGFNHAAGEVRAAERGGLVPGRRFANVGFRLSRSQ